VKPAVQKVKAAIAERGLDRQVIELQVHARTSQQAADALGVAVGQIAGGRIRRADPITVKQATGYSIGGVPPIGLESELAVYVDRDLLGYELVYAAAGLPECVFPIAPDELVRATGGHVVDIKEAGSNSKGARP
jgi:prolyl-tRNA editing enzyme YbaK/EbsC (Cys-tRNA(Pro) deacylase)